MSQILDFANKIAFYTKDEEQKVIAAVANITRNHNQIHDETQFFRICKVKGWHDAQIKRLELFITAEEMYYFSSSIADTMELSVSELKTIISKAKLIFDEYAISIASSQRYNRPYSFNDFILKIKKSIVDSNQKKTATYLFNTYKDPEYLIVANLSSSSVLYNVSKKDMDLLAYAVKEFHNITDKPTITAVKKELNKLYGDIYSRKLHAHPVSIKILEIIGSNDSILVKDINSVLSSSDTIDEMDKKISKMIGGFKINKRSNSAYNSIVLDLMKMNLHKSLFAIFQILGAGPIKRVFEKGGFWNNFALMDRKLKLQFKDYLVERKHWPKKADSQIVLGLCSSMNVDEFNFAIDLFDEIDSNKNEMSNLNDRFLTALSYEEFSKADNLIEFFSKNGNFFVNPNHVNKLPSMAPFIKCSDQFLRYINLPDIGAMAIKYDLKQIMKFVEIGKIYNENPELLL